MDVVGGVCWLTGGSIEDNDTCTVRSATEMRSFLVSRSRRRIGVTVVQAMARHRLARVPYIGVPRDIVATRMQRGPQQRGHPHPYAPEPGHADFYQYQAAPLLIGAA